MSEHNLPYSRRLFMRHGVALASMATTIPQFIQNSALGMMSQLAGILEVPDFRKIAFLLWCNLAVEMMA